MEIAGGHPGRLMMAGAPHIFPLGDGKQTGKHDNGASAKRDGDSMPQAAKAIFSQTVAAPRRAGHTSKQIEFLHERDGGSIPRAACS